MYYIAVTLRVGSPTLVFVMEVNNLEKEHINKIKEIARNKAEELGYELVDAEYKTGNKHDLLSIYIYRDGGIDLDDCAVLSHAIDSDLDSLEFLKNPYYLEVSSPGLDRPIKTKDDYRRNIGKDVTVKLYAPINGKKVFEGILKEYNDENVVLEIDNNNMEISIKSISNMVQTIKF